MIPQEALQKASEGGWPRPTNTTYNRYSETKTVLDPLFWQALGKALGWPPQENYAFADRPDLAQLTWGEIKATRPFARAHVFYEIVLTGGDTEAFWNEILGTNGKTQ